MEDVLMWDTSTGPLRQDNFAILTSTARYQPHPDRRRLEEVASESGRESGRENTKFGKGSDSAT